MMGLKQFQNRKESGGSLRSDVDNMHALAIPVLPWTSED